MTEIRPGQIWWDKDKVWCDGSNYLNIIFVVLSGDKKDGEMLWSLANFMWFGTGYCGADIRKFGENEVHKMYLIGNLSDIKRFDE